MSGFATGRHTPQHVVEEVRRLRNIGYTDVMIADALGMHRVSVTNIRIKNDIPKRDTGDLVDREYKCFVCGETHLKKRNDNLTRICPKCRADIEGRISERKAE